MCFSATASFVAGASLSAIGTGTLKKTTTKKQVPFASIPLLFGLQQLVEGVVWLSFTTPWLNALTTYTYAGFAYFLWPIFTPFAVLSLEEVAWRRKLLKVFIGIGLLVDAYIFYWIIQDTLTSSIAHNSIAYYIEHFGSFTYLNALNMILYVVATVGSCLLSSYKKVNFFGITLFISFLAAFFAFSTTFYSTWCFFAAILSVIIFWHFKSEYHKSIVSPTS